MSTDTIADQSILQEADQAAEQIAAQQRAGGGETATPEQMRAANDLERGGAFDDAFAEAQKSVPKEFSGESGTENGGVIMPLEGAPKEEPAPKEEIAEAPLVEPVVTTEPAKPKSILDSVAATGETKPGVTPPADPYADVKLRSDASPKTRETFEQLKSVAKQREDAARAEAETVRKEAEELRLKLAEVEKRTVPPETEAELKELREFRAQYGAEHTPEFKAKFDGRINQNLESIYKQLSKHGLAETEVQKLRAFAPEDRNLAIENFLGKLPTADKRLIELKLADNLVAEEDRAKELASVRSKAQEFIQKEKTAPAEQAAQRFESVASILKPALAKVAWVHVKDIPANTPPEVKKELEAHNKFAAEVQEDLKYVLTNDTPEARAEAAIAVPYSKYLQRENAGLKSQLEAATKKLAAIDAASRTARTARSSASTVAPAPAAPKIEGDRDDHIDALFQEALTAQRR